MTDTIVLYGVASPNVVKVGIMLEELGLPYELCHVGVFKGEQFAPEFLALNPLAKVPVLVDPALGKPVIESGAILMYLGERTGKFYPAAGPARYDVMQWVMVQMANMGPMFGQLNHFRSVRKGADTYAVARFTELSRQLYKQVDDRVRSAPWIAGGDYSIADMAMYPWALYLERQGFEAKDFPAMIAWRDKIAARPAVARSKVRFDEAFSQMATTDRKTATDSDMDRLFRRTPSAPANDYGILRG
jgi:GST-like protein